MTGRPEVRAAELLEVLEGWAGRGQAPGYVLAAVEELAGLPVRRSCARCGLRKPVTAFRRTTRGYLASWCRPCALEGTQAWRARVRPELNARRRAARAAARSPHTSRTPAPVGSVPSSGAGPRPGVLPTTHQEARA